jgi:hypothetical protein
MKRNTGRSAGGDNGLGAPRFGRAVGNNLNADPVGDRRSGINQRCLNEKEIVEPRRGGDPGFCSSGKHVLNGF